MHLGFFFSCLFCFIKKLICIPTDGFKISFFANVFPLFLHTDCLTACNQTQSNSNKGTINRVHLPVSEILFLAYCFNLYILLRRYLGECKTETLLSQIMQWKLQSSSINELISKSLIMLGILDVMVCVCFCNLKRFSLGYSMWRRKLKMLPHRSKHGSFFWAQQTTAPGQTAPEGSFHLLPPSLLHFTKLFISLWKSFFMSLHLCETTGPVFFCPAVSCLNLPRSLYFLLHMIHRDKHWVSLFIPVL